VGLIRSFLSTLGACSQNVLFDDRRELSYPFPVSESDRMSKASDFCDFYGMRLGQRLKFMKVKNQIFVLTYADLVEWPPTLDELVQKVPYALLLFVPGGFVSSAFEEMKRIWKRHEERKMYYESRTDDPKAEMNLKVVNSAVEFVSTLQWTLMKKLKVPVAMMNAYRFVCD
jgi:hypothetical protein